MSDTSGIGGTTPSKGPSELSELSQSPGGGDLMHAKIRTLDDLKNVLIQHLGEKKGMKFYNQFLTTFAMMMVQQMQQSADQAKKQSDELRSQSGY